MRKHKTALKFDVWMEQIINQYGDDDDQRKIEYVRNFLKEKLSKYWKNKRMYNANTTDREQSYNESDCGSRSMSFLILMKTYGQKCIDVI